MLQELALQRKSKEEFLAEYRPIRQSVENFLRQGTKYNGNVFEAIESFVYRHEFGYAEFPFYQRDTEGLLAGSATKVNVTVKTEGQLYPYAKRIEDSFISISVKEESDPDGRVAILPPLGVLQSGEYKIDKFKDVPTRVADVLPFLR